MDKELRDAFADLKKDFSDKYEDLKEDTKHKHRLLFDKVDAIKSDMDYHKGKHSELGKKIDGVNKNSVAKGSAGGGVAGVITSVVINLINHFLFRRDG